MSLSLSIGTKVLTQLPFELKLTMPPTDRGGRGYSDKYVFQVRKELSLS